MAVPWGQSDSYGLEEGLQRQSWSSLWEGRVIPIKSRASFKGIQTLKNGAIFPEWVFLALAKLELLNFLIIISWGEGFIFSDVGESEWLISQAEHRQCAVQDCTMETPPLPSQKHLLTLLWPSYVIFVLPPSPAVHPYRSVLLLQTYDMSVPI